MRVLKFFRKLLKFSMPLSLILLPLLALYGSLAPWPPAEAGFSTYNGQTSLLTGISYRSDYSSVQGRTVTSSRSYVLLPSVFTNPKIITFTQKNGGIAEPSESTSALFSLLFWLILCCIGTWWFWLRRAPPKDALNKPSSNGRPNEFF